MTVSAVFNGQQSWKIPLINGSNPQLDQNLLDHEQQHYNITALVARDLFTQLMQERLIVYKTQLEVSNSFNQWKTSYWNQVAAIQKEYDDETGHSQANVFVPSTNIFTPPESYQKGGPQRKWEGLIASAFTATRPGGGTLPDGTPYMKELTVFLKDAGITITISS